MELRAKELRNQEAMLQTKVFCPLLCALLITDTLT